MLFKDIAILDEQFAYQEHQWVGVTDATISYIGSEAPSDPATYGEVYDGRGKLLMPAFYNAHSHASMVMLRGFAENLPLHAWLQQKCWPFEAKMVADDNYWGTLLAGLEMLRYGVVGFSDMYFYASKRAQAVDELGMKANLSDTFIATDSVEEKLASFLAEMENGFATLDGMSDGRIRYEGCVHAEYTNTDFTAKSLIDLTKSHASSLHIHLSETEHEVEDCRGRHNGMSPVQWFESLGAFDIPTIAAHCVWVDDEDIAILAEHNVTVAHNPASNLKLASGFAPISQMLDAGVNVALGTDGMASNNNHDMFQDMYLTAMLPKGEQFNPTLITPQQALYAATRAGALAQGREDCGLIKQGFRADMCVLDVTGPSWCPVNDMPTNVVYAGHGSDVVLTMCDGRVVYREGIWPGIDVERIKAEVVERTTRIQNELAQS